MTWMKSKNKLRIKNMLVSLDLLWFILTKFFLLIYIHVTIKPVCRNHLESVFVCIMTIVVRQHAMQFFPVSFVKFAVLCCHICLYCHFLEFPICLSIFLKIIYLTNQILRTFLDEVLMTMQ